MNHSDVPDPRCPECGEPIGMTASFCMHCSADLTEARARMDVDGDGYWDDHRLPDTATAPGRSTSILERVVAGEGTVAKLLLAVVGIGGGFVITVIGTAVLLLLTSSAWVFPVGVLGWIATTAYLLRGRTVLEALVGVAYGMAIVLSLVPLIAFGPADGGTALGARLVVFLVLMGGVAIPVALCAGIGFALSKFAIDPGRHE